MSVLQEVIQAILQEIIQEVQLLLLSKPVNFALAVDSVEECIAVVVQESAIIVMVRG